MKKVIAILVLVIGFAFNTNAQEVKNSFFRTNKRRVYTKTNYVI